MASGRILNFDSCHHINQKLGTAIGFTQRVLALGNVNRVNENTTKIYEILGKNNFPKQVIQQIVTRCQKDKENSEMGLARNQNTSRPFYRSMVYLKGLSEQLSKIIRHENDRLVLGFKSPCDRLRDIVFANKKDPIPTDN